MLFVIGVCLLFCYLHAVPAQRLTVQAEGSTATERTMDISLQCDVPDIAPEDELVGITWFQFDPPYGTYNEIFNADLTSDQPAYYFSAGWAGRGLYANSGIGSIILPARYVTRDLTGVYRCQVNSLFSSGSADVKVDILYGPGSSIINMPGDRVERQEGESLVFTCSAECNPACQYRWYKAGKKVSDAAVLEMTPLSRDDAGLYACQARNDAGRSIKPVELKIFFPASVTSLNVSRVDAGKPSGDRPVPSGAQTVVFSCHVRGWPEVSTEWLKNGVGINVASNSTSVTTSQIDADRKRSKFELKSATCLDNGEYSCKTWNGVGDASTQSIVLNLKCSPFEVSRDVSCTIGQEVHVIKNFDEKVRVHVCFYGYPVPGVTFEHRTAGGKKEAVGGSDVVCDDVIKHCQATLELNMTSPAQYGVYDVTVINAHGRLHKTITVTSQHPPCLPAVFQSVNTTHDSACFLWDGCFNEGSKQVYTLTYRQKQEGLKVADETGHGGVVSVVEGETGQNQNYSVCVTNLLPSAEYEAVLTSSNKYGQAAASKVTSFETLNQVKEALPSQSWLKLPSVDQRSSHDENEPITSQLPFSEDDTARLVLRPPKNRPSYATHTTSKPLRVTKKLKHDDDSDDDDWPEPDDPDDDINFFQFFDAFFAIDSPSDTNGTLKPKSLSNFSMHLRHLINNYARVQDSAHALYSLNRLRLPIAPNNESQNNATTATSKSSAPTPDHESSNVSSLLTTLTVSATAVATLFILAIVIALTCVSFVKRSRRLKACQDRHLQRMKANNRIHAKRGNAIARVSQIPLVRNAILPPNSGSDERAPSITFVCNENAVLPSQVTMRPRLSTPEIISKRSKLRLSSSLPSDPCNVKLRKRELPVIAREKKRASCPTYLDLYPSSSSVQVNDTQKESQRDAVSPSPTPEKPLPVNTPGYLSSRSSFSSLNSIDPCQSSDAEAEKAMKYLEFYEALGASSRSRSPSNVYDPLHFDCGGGGTCLSLNPLQRRTQRSEKSKLEEMVCSRPGKSKRLASGQQSSKHMKKTKEAVVVPQRVRSDKKSLAMKASENLRQQTNDLGPSSPNRSRAKSNMAETNDHAKKIILPNDDYLMPRDFSYANSRVLNQSTPSSHRECCYANIPKQDGVIIRIPSTCRHRDAFPAHVYDTRISGEGSPYDDAVSIPRVETSAGDPYYVDIDTYRRGRLYVEMKAGYESSQGKSSRTRRSNSAQKKPMRVSRHAGGVLCVSCNDGGNGEYFVPVEGEDNNNEEGTFSPPRHRVVCCKNCSREHCSCSNFRNDIRRKQASVPMSLKDALCPPPRRSQTSSKTAPLDDACLRRVRSAVKAYMVTDCVSVDFREEDVNTGGAQERDASVDAPTNIYDEVGS